MPTESFLLTLRNAAKDCPDILIRKLLRDAADRIVAAIQALQKHTSVDNMRDLNAEWAKAHRLLDKATTAPDPNSTGGRLHAPAPPQMAEAKAA